MSETPSFLDGVIRAGDASVGKIKALLYGDPGTGKTSLGATMPQPSLHLLSEGHGDLAVKRVQPNADIIKIKNYDHLIRILDGLTFEDHPYKSVCLDSLTDMQEMVKKNMKGDEVAVKMSLPDWGTLQELTKDVVKRFRDLDVHVCVIALSADTQEPDGPIIRGPAMAGKKLPKSLPAYFNIVGYMMKKDDPDTNEPVHRTVMHAGERLVTKTHPALDPVEVPDFSVWVNKINAGEGGNMPTEVTTKDRPVDPEAAAQDLAEIIVDDPKVQSLLEELESINGARIPLGKRLARARKYGSADAMIKALSEAIVAADNAAQDALPPQEG